MMHILNTLRKIGWRNKSLNDGVTIIRFISICCVYIRGFHAEVLDPYDLEVWTLGLCEKKDPKKVLRPGSCNC